MAKQLRNEQLPAAKARNNRLRIVILHAVAMLFTVNVYAGSLYAQQKVSVTLNDVTIEQVIREVERQSGYIAVYNNTEIEALSNVSVSSRDESAEDVLNKVLGKFGMHCMLSNDFLVISSAVSGSNVSRQQQPIRVTGRVLDTNGNPLAGATVLEKGSPRGTSTDVNGNFEFAVTSVNSVLVVQYLGMITKEVPVLPGQPNVITLESSDTQITEVSVISTGIFTRDRVTATGNAPSYTQADLKQLGGNNVLQSLTLADPSLRFVENSLMGSDPNSMPTIELRGMSTPTLNMVQDEFSKDPNSPLFLINGVEVNIDKVNDLDMNRVESITILKDAGSTAIWGSKGANGVVVIELIKPRAGEYNITYNGTLAVEGPDLSVYNMMNAREKYDFDVLADKFNTRGLPGTELMKLQSKILADIRSGVDTYWLSEPVRTGIQHSHSLRVSGGSEELSVDVGAKYGNNQGAMKGSSRQTWGGDVNLTYRVDRWIVSNYLDISGYNATGSPYGSFSKWIEAIPYYKKYNEYGEVEKWLQRADGLGSYDYGFAGGSSPLTGNIPNPLWNARLNNKDQTNQFYVANTLFAQYDVNPNLKFTASLELVREEREAVKFLDPDHTDFGHLDDVIKGKYTNSRYLTWWYKLSGSMSYVKAVGDHRFTFMANANMKDSRDTYYHTEAIGFPLNSKGSPNLAMAYNIIENPGRPGYNNKVHRVMSLAAVLNYSYDKRYLVDITASLDGSTTFGSNKLYKPFFSVGLGWNISQEKFAENWNAIDLMKLSVTYGTNGNQSLGKVYSKSVYQYYVYSNKFGQGSYIRNLGAPDLPWQAVEKFEVTLNVDMKRFSLALSMYRNVTDPLIISVTQLPSTGLEAFPMHIGTLTKHGFDWDVKFYPIYNREQDITWSVSINGDHYKQKYGGFANAMEGMNEEFVDANIMKRYQDGKSPNDIWAVPSYGIDPSSGREIFIKKDGSLTYQYDARDQIVAGSDRPTFAGTAYTTFQYKNFDMTLAFGYQWGAHKYNSTIYDRVENISKAKLGSQNQDRRALHDRWQRVGDIAVHPGIAVTDARRPLTSRLIQMDNYFNGSSIRLGYRLYNNEWLIRNLGIGRLQVNLQGKDLFRLETSKVERGIDYPFARTVTMNLTIGF